MAHIFYSLISFFIAIFFVLLGVISVMIPWVSTIQMRIIQFILEDSLAISLFGFAFIVVGLAIVANIIISSKKRHYHLHVKNNPVIVDQMVFEQYLHMYWKQLFPEKEIPTQLTIKKNRFFIAADLPAIPESEQKPLLNRIKEDLESTFTKLLGHPAEFYLSISFQPLTSAPTQKL